jgi:hypothetical protein
MIETIIYSLGILGIIITILSIISQIILSHNGYKVKILRSHFIKEISSLWELSKAKRKYRKLALVYRVLFIMFFIDLLTTVFLLIANTLDAR